MYEIIKGGLISWENPQKEMIKRKLIQELTIKEIKIKIKNQNQRKNDFGKDIQN